METKGYPPIYEVIEAEVKKLGRNLRRGVLPWQVQASVSMGGAEFTFRRYMVDMWRLGLIRRVGGEGSRQGYRVLSPIERRMEREIPLLLMPPSQNIPPLVRVDTAHHPPSLVPRMGGLAIGELAVVLGLSDGVVGEYVGWMCERGVVVIEGECVRLPTALEKVVFSRVGRFPV